MRHTIIPTAALLLTSALPSIAAEVPYIPGTGWREFITHYSGQRLNSEGEFTFTIYPGQQAVLTVTDYGWNYEAYEILNKGVWTGWSTSGASSGLWTSSYDTSSTSPGWGPVEKPLTPGTYKLRFQIQRAGSELRSDIPGQYSFKAAFKVTILQTPDADEDRIADTFETGTGIYISPVDTGTDPNKSDTDGDGLDDWTEIHIHTTDPNKTDTDGDGFLDPAEIAAGKSPTDPASNPDATLEARTAVEITLYTQLGATYQIEWSDDLQTWTPLPGIITGDGTPITRFQSTKEHPYRYFRAAKTTTPQP